MDLSGVALTGMAMLSLQLVTFFQREMYFQPDSSLLWLARQQKCKGDMVVPAWIEQAVMENLGGPRPIITE